MEKINYDYLENIVLIVWDEKENYQKEVNKIGVDLFQESHQIQSLPEFQQILDKYENNQNFLFLVHLFHNEEKKGFFDFRSSKLKKDFPGLSEYLITSAPKRKIYEDGEQLIVFSYDDFPIEVGRIFKPQTKNEILGESIIKEEKSPYKKGIFLSHSSKDAVIVEKFRDIVLIGGLGCSLKDIMFTSREEGGIHGGINIPDELHDFLKNKMGLFIQFLSKNYRESETCVNEEGAAWVLLEKIMLVPFLLPNSSSDQLSWIMNLNKGINMDSKSSLLNVYEGRKSFFPNCNSTNFNNKVDEFLKYLK